MPSSHDSPTPASPFPTDSSSSTAAAYAVPQGLSGSPLGQTSRYCDTYTPSLLFPLPRQIKRDEIGLADPAKGTHLPFVGADLWTIYELSWLTPRGKPQVALAHVTVPCESPHIIESKSFKLYLNSFNMSRFDDADAVRACLVTDLSAACGVRVGVSIVLPEMFGSQKVAELPGVNLDRLDLECSDYQPVPDLLSATVGEQPVTETLRSQLLKSNCLVTGQPDWGSVQISYSGPQIDQVGLLRYLVSFRNHNEFHEQCVERIFMDITRHCRPTKLMIYARYTRRGGLDINPLRSSHPMNMPASVRTARQ